VNGEVGLVWSQGGSPRVVFGFTIEDDRIVGIEMLADPERLQAMDVEALES
jgi:hypothetical protein